MNAVPPTTSRLKVIRGGSAITRQIPKPTILIDTREQRPFNFSRFDNWCAGEQRVALETGDYSVAGMESVIALERKSLPDLLMTLSHNRSRFIRECERMMDYPHRAILIEASYEEVKSPYAGEFSQAHPNGISGSLDAIEARFHIPIIYASRHRILSEEKAASWLSKAFTYCYLEAAGLGRVLQEGDL